MRSHHLWETIDNLLNLSRFTLVIYIHYCQLPGFTYWRTCWTHPAKCNWRVWKCEDYEITDNRNNIASRKLLATWYKPFRSRNYLISLNCTGSSAANYRRKSRRIFDRRCSVTRMLSRNWNKAKNQRWVLSTRFQWTSVKLNWSCKSVGDGFVLRWCDIAGRSQLRPELWSWFALPQTPDIFDMRHRLWHFCKYTHKIYVY